MKDYKKKYNEVLERLKRLIKNDTDHVIYEDDILECVPELRESEDEKIRKDIISLVIKWWKDDGAVEPKFSTQRSMLAWLEKQGEKPADGKKRYFSDICVDADEFRNKIMEFLHKDKSLGLDESFWGKETVEQLKKFTDEGSKKIMEAMRKIVFAREPKYQDLMDEYCEAWKDIKEVSLSEKLAYYIGLLRMYNYLKEGK